MPRIGRAAGPAAAGRRFRRVLRGAVTLIAAALAAAILPGPPAAAQGISKVGTLDRRSGTSANPANGNLLLDHAHRRGYQTAYDQGRMLLYEVDLDTLRLLRTAEIPELMPATTTSGPAEWLWSLDATRRRIFAVARIIDPTLRVEAYALATVDLRTMRATATQMLWSGSQRLPIAISYHAPSDRLYVMTRLPVEPAFRSRYFVEERTPAGERAWEELLPPCYGAVDYQFPPVLARSVLQPDNLYLNCYNSGNVQAQIVRLTLGAQGPERQEVFSAVPGPLSAMFDAGSDRIFFLTINGGAGRGAWVFDGIRSSFLGVIASGDSRLGASEYAMGIDPATGRLYMETPAGFLVADARRTPLPSGLLFRSLAGRTTGTIHVDPVKRWVYVPDPDFKNDVGQSLRYLVLADTIRVSKDPPPGDPDSLTVDVAEKRGETDANYSGGARAYAVRSLTTGGVQRAAWNVALGQLSPEEQTTGTIYQTMLQAPADPSNRDVSLARVRHATLSNQSSEAAVTFGEGDPGTKRDAQGAGASWPFQAAECADDGDDVESASGTGAAATCDVVAASTTASTSVAGAAAEPGAAVSARALLAFGAVERDPRDGLVATSIAVVRDLSLLGRVHIAEVRAAAQTRARGRPGTARGSFERSFQGVRADTDGDGTYDFSCDACDAGPVAAALREALAGQAAVELPEPDPAYYAGSKGGYQAVVQKETFRGFAERSLNEDDSPEVAALQIVLFADARAGRSRQIVQIAGVQAESHYGIYLLGSDEPDPCAAGACEAPSPPPAPKPTVAPAPHGDPPPVPVAAEPKTVTERILRRFAAGTQVALARPRDALLLAALWSFLLLPAYIIWRRRFAGVARP